MIIYNTFNGITRTFFYTFITVIAFLFVFLDSKDTHLLKDPGDKTCWAEKLAKWPAINQTCQNDDGHNNDYITLEMPMEKLKWVEQIIYINTEYKDKQEKDCKK